MVSPVSISALTTEIVHPACIVSTALSTISLNPDSAEEPKSRRPIQYTGYILIQFYGRIYSEWCTSHPGLLRQKRNVLLFQPLSENKGHSGPQAVHVDTARDILGQH